MTADDNTVEHIAKSLVDIIMKQITGINLNKPVYTRKEVLQMLDIDSKTLKRYQDEGYIAYSQPIDGGKVFFSLKDIEEFMQRTRREAFYFNGLNSLNCSLPSISSLTVSGRNMA